MEIRVRIAARPQGACSSMGKNAIPSFLYTLEHLSTVGKASDKRLMIVRLYLLQPESLSRSLEGFVPMLVKEKMRGGPMWFETHRE